MPKRPKKVVIIGAGYGGLSAACFLQQAGYRVTIVDQLNQIGGRASVSKEDGFTFDRGPSWYLMPEVFERFFQQFGHDRKDLYRISKLDPSYQVIFPDETVTIKPDLDTNIKTFDTFEPNGGNKLRKYLTTAKKNYELFMKHFVYRSFDSPMTLFDPAFAKHAGRILGLTTSLHTYVSRYFTSQKARQILEYPAVFLGNSPYNAPAIYSILTHTDMNQGVFYPQGGFGTVTKAIGHIAKELGVHVELGQKVIAIEHKLQKAQSVRTSKQSFEADIIISNADYATTELHLLNESGRSYPQSYWDRKTIGPSAILAYIGIDMRVQNATHHTLYFAKQWNRHFDAIFKDKQIPTDPSFYACMPTVSDKTVAPKGKENLFLLIPMPAGLQPTEKQQQTLVDNACRILEKKLGSTFKHKIVHQEIVAKDDFEKTYGAYQGTALGLAHTLFQSAWFRPKHKSQKLPNLYFAGAYTHPGVGTPTSLISGEVVARRIIDEFPN